MQEPFANDRLGVKHKKAYNRNRKDFSCTPFAYLYNHIKVMKNNPVGVVMLTISYFLGIADFFFYL